MNTSGGSVNIASAKENQTISANGVYTWNMSNYQQLICDGSRTYFYYQNIESDSGVINWQISLNVDVYPGGNLFTSNTYAEPPTDLNNQGGNDDQNFIIALNTTSAEVAATNFTIIATNEYSKIPLSNISASITNGVLTYNYSAINQINTTLPSNSTSLWNVTVWGAGYFSKIYQNYNISTNLNTSLYQATLELHARNGLGGNNINIFNLTVGNYFINTTNGTISGLKFNASAGIPYTIMATSFLKKSGVLTFAELENKNQTIDLETNLTVQLMREENNSLIPFAELDSAILNVYCGNNTIVHTFAASNESVAINCVYDFMMLTVTQDNQSYFRTLIPDYTATSMSWYIFDLNEDLVVQRILALNDLTGEYTQGIIKIKRYIGESDKTITSQFFDVEDKVILYLIKNSLYKVYIQANDGSERVIGNLIADSAGEQTLTLPSIEFAPKNSVLGQNISWNYIFNNQLLRVTYNDTTGLTTNVKFIIYNGTNLSQEIFSGSSSSSEVVFSYNHLNENGSYATVLNITYPGLANIVDKKVFTGSGERYIDDTLTGWTDTERVNILKWVSIIALVIWGLLWSSKYIGLGIMTTAGLAWVLYFIGWFPISVLWLSFVTLIAGLVFVMEGINKP